MLHQLNLVVYSNRVLYHKKLFLALLRIFTRPPLEYLGQLLTSATMWQTQIRNISRYVTVQMIERPADRLNGLINIHALGIQIFR